MSSGEDYIFICECPNEFRSACLREIFYREADGKRYCVLHYPLVEKARDFEQAMLRKYHSRDYDFRGVYFPTHFSFYKGEFFEDADFRDAVFNGQVNLWSSTFHKKADFGRAIFTSYATFKSAQFLGEAEFGKATFSDTTYFEEARFNKEASFMETTFKAYAYFGEAAFEDKVHFLWTKFETNSYFNMTSFGDISQFSGTKFAGDVRFGGAVFKANVYLNGAEFEERAVFMNSTFGAVAKFNGSIFSSDANFSKVQFQENSFGSFVNSLFKDRLRFVETAFENRSALNFSLATFEKPERVYFSRVKLHPYWFLYADPRKFNFTKVEWCNVRSYRTIRLEVDELKAKGADEPYHFLSIACRQLAANAEDNDRFREAADLRFLAMELQRRESWHNLKSLPWKWSVWRNLGVLHWLYGFASGYGERVGQAGAVLLSILIAFACVYYFWQSDGQWWRNSQNASANVSSNIPASEPTSLGLRDSLIYSAYVMALQKPEPQPLNRRAKMFVFLEMIVGPSQAALLVLAIRRKFMR